MRALVLLALLGVTCAVPQRMQRIVGGSPTTVSNYPYMCNMQYNLGSVLWTQWCGGTLISSRSVLSAAHCFYGDIAIQWRVLVGTSYASSGGSAHQAAALILHEAYNPTVLTNDVAVIRLATPVVMTSSLVSVARIAGPYYNLPDGAVATAIGWGSLWSNGPYPEQLQHVDVNIINQELCAARYAELKSQPGYEGWPDITPGMVCAGFLDQGGRDACQGDSGGPLAVGDVVVGITSWGFGCAHEIYPGVNARVSYYADWIVSNGSD